MPQKPSPAATLDLDTARSAWVRHQGLGDAVADTPAEVLAQTGWIRTLGGVDGYLSLLARRPGLRAAAIHAAVGDRTLQVLPSVRGCMYLVPRRHAALSLSIGRDLSARRDTRDREKAGVTDAEMDELGEAVLEAVATGPRSTTQLRRDVPDGLIRSLGEAGKKIGITSTLPPTLRQLEFAGRLVRQPIDDRLDSERYAWATGDPEALRDDRSADDRQAALMSLLLRWMAPATADELAAFSGLGKRATRAALKAVGATPVTVEGRDTVGWMGPEQVAHLHQPVPPSPRLLPALDTLLAWHGGPAVFVHPRDRDRKIPVWGRQRGHTWATITHSMARVVFSGGQVCGRWEWDPDTQQVVCGPYAPGLPEGATAAAHAAGDLLREIGHGLPFSITTDDDLRARCAQVRALPDGPREPAG